MDTLECDENDFELYSIMNREPMKRFQCRSDGNAMGEFAESSSSRVLKLL
jgi:hypothetical protein